jgi:hypothetical protein
MQCCRRVSGSRRFDRTLIPTSLKFIRSVHVRLVVKKVALGQVFLRAVQFSPVSIIPPTLHTHLHLHVALTRRINRWAWEPSKKQCSSGYRGALDRNILSLLSALLVALKWRESFTTERRPYQIQKASSLLLVCSHTTLSLFNII